MFTCLKLFFFIIFSSIFLFSQKSLKVTEKDGKLQVEGYDDIDIGDDGKLKVNSYSITVRKKDKQKNKQKNKINNSLKKVFPNDDLPKINDIVPKNSFFFNDPSKQSPFGTNNFPLFKLNEFSNHVTIKTNIKTNFTKQLKITNTIKSISNFTVVTNFVFITNTITNQIDNYTNTKQTNYTKQTNQTKKENPIKNKLSDDEMIALIYKAGKLKKQKRYGELIELLNYIEKQGGEDYSLRYRIKLMQGTVYYQLKLYDQAKKKWQESLKLKPNQPKLQAALQRLFFSKK